MAKPALGRGLGALLGGAPIAPKAMAPAVLPEPTEVEENSSERVIRIPLRQIHPSVLQPRKDFPPEALQELADSIRAQGVLQPLILRPRGSGFELIAGERRWRAAQMIGLEDVPALVREADDRKVLELMLIENLQRENLNALEEALGYRDLIEQFELTQEEVSERVGKSRAAVANSLRLLKLATDIQTHLKEGRLSVGHAKVILSLSDPREQTLAAERIIRDSLNVRQTENLVAHLQGRKPDRIHEKRSAVNRAWKQDANAADVVSRLQERLATKVNLRYHEGKGAIEIHFFNDDDLQRILELLGLNTD